MYTVLQQLNEEMGDVVARVGRSLVQVRNSGRGTGAGTIWHPDGLIITNAHVVSVSLCRYPPTLPTHTFDRGALQVTLPDGSVTPAHLLAYDAGYDLAALAVDATNLPTISLGESSRLMPGQWVIALGHPWGVIGAATAGVVIGMGPVLSPAEGPEGQEAGPSGREWVAVSLHLRPGYSGGPLIDVQGRLVGINTVMTGPDVGMAVPVHVVKVFLRQKLGSGNVAA